LIFDSRLQTCNSQKSQFEERIAQLKEEIGGVTGQIEAKTREIGYIETELRGLRPSKRRSS
jgi:HlyD family secretion protein